MTQRERDKQTEVIFLKCIRDTKYVREIKKIREK